MKEQNIKSYQKSHGMQRRNYEKVDSLHRTNMRLMNSETVASKTILLFALSDSNSRIRHDFLLICLILSVKLASI